MEEAGALAGGGTLKRDMPCAAAHLAEAFRSCSQVV